MGPLPAKKKKKKKKVTPRDETRKSTLNLADDRRLGPRVLEQFAGCVVAVAVVRDGLHVIAKPLDRSHASGRLVVAVIESVRELVQEARHALRAHVAGERANERLLCGFGRESTPRNKQRVWYRVF